MATQTKKRKSKGRKRREYRRKPKKKQYVFYVWIRIVERNRFRELTRFWLHFTLKECNLKFTKGPPHKLPNSRQSLKNAPCSSIFYAWVSAADNWWQPKQTSRKKMKKRKSKGRKRREYKRTPSRKHSVNNFWIRIVERNRFPELRSSWHTLHYNNAIWSSQRGPLTSCQILGNHCIDKCIIFIDILCFFFFVWVSAADNWWQPKQRKGKARVGREENTGGNPKKKQYVFYVWIRIVERNRFRELTSFWLHFTLKECNLKFTKGPPHKLPNSRQSLKNAPCSSIFYA